ncbi:microviridin/marinostatin family tricyclic proteinase inhibitor [Brasilonema sp. UFV-L1]|uniref:microviridin/marinostatin family tricyclic proteinase inhibitor n=1 Tax=Brasilonema sp. UFV-L1 TaxID=2234130 RepID=UPI00145CFC48|nr:microviridin/marinostatin family tricyclic proteinase inhibitor [Brasilonema sp. UFV-L1]NMG05765.1 serine endopeptidase inhibitor [Brasilonema sp. UFV-L1]
MSDNNKPALNANVVPFFARYLEGQFCEDLTEEEMQEVKGGIGYATTLAYPSDNESPDNIAYTLKYPSDEEDGFSQIATKKYPSDNDEYTVTQNYPSNSDDDYSVTVE